MGDVDRGYYRSREEEQFWREQRDPITLAREWLESEGLADRTALDAIAGELGQQLDAAVEFAVAAPFPNIDQVATDVFA